MGYTLEARPADVQGLKAAASAAVVGTPLAIKLLKNDAADGSKHPVAGVVLRLDDGSTVTEPNAIAKLLGGWRLRELLQRSYAPS